MEIKVKRIIRLVAISRKYHNAPYMALPARDEKLGTWITGQHRDPMRSETIGYLTPEQMTGKVPPTIDQIKKFDGYIIDPLKHIPFHNLQSFDLSRYENGEAVNGKDIQLYNFARNFLPNVAPAKSAVNNSTHHFYFEDKEADAVDYVKKEDMIYEAEKLIRENCTIGDYRNKILLLNHKVKNFTLDVDVLSDNQIKMELIKMCKNSPEEIIACFGKKAEEELYILKLVKHNILTYKDGSYYDGSFFIADTLDKVRSFVKNPIGENARYASKWGKLLLQAEGKMPPEGMGGTPVKEWKAPEKSDLDTTEENQDPQLRFLKEVADPELRQYAIDKRYPKVDYKDLDTNQLRQYLIERYKKSSNK